jgi:SAM-dependent methyltransferase
VFGERVIPGEVEPELWNEHISRYQFAALFAAGKTVLDVGCGAGYGTALLAERAVEAAGFDTSPEAVAYARAHFSAPRFLAGSADAFPTGDTSVDLVTAFEVFGHHADWRSLIEEARRVLKDDGVFLVSMTNEEFELPTFQEALASAFPFMRAVGQNRQECIVFADEQAASSGLSFTAAPLAIAQAHSLIAVCTRQPVDIPFFVYVPIASNWLSEREHYITDLSLTRAEARVTRADLAVARAELERLLHEREMAANSRWVRLGRKFHLGPNLRTTPS